MSRVNDCRGNGQRTQSLCAQIEALVEFLESRIRSFMRRSALYRISPLSSICEAHFHGANCLDSRRTGRFKCHRWSGVKTLTIITRERRKERRRSASQRLTTFYGRAGRKASRAEKQVRVDAVDVAEGQETLDGTMRACNRNRFDISSKDFVRALSGPLDL